MATDPPDDQSGDEAEEVNEVSEVGKDAGTDTGTTVDNDAGLTAELERLRAENARLRSEVDAESTQAATTKTLRRRTAGALVLLILGSVMLPVSVLTVWTRNQVLDTDRYVETVAPLASDPVIQSTLANRISQKVSDEVDIKSLAQEALPEKASFLAGPIASGADNLIHQAATKLVESERFENLWVKANRRGHTGLVAALTGEEGELISTDQGKVVLKLGALAEGVLKNIDKQFGIDLASTIPAERLNVNFVLVDSQQLSDVQAGVRWLDRLSWFALFLSLAFLGGSVAASPDRRKGVLRVGFGVALSMLALFVGFGIGRDVYLTHLPSEVERPDAAAVIFDTLTRFVLQAIRLLFAVGVVLLVGAWVIGPGRGATRIRSYWDRLLGRGSSLTGSHVSMGPVPRFFSDHISALRGAVIALAVVVLLFWGRPTGKVVLLIAFGVLVLMAIIQLIAGVAGQPSTEVEVEAPPGSVTP